MMTQQQHDSIMGRLKATAGELVAISLVCLFAISPLFVFMCAFVLPKCCCLLRRRKRQRAPDPGLGRASETTGLLSSESDSGYAADNEASSDGYSSYGSTLTQSDESEEAYWHNVSGSRPVHATIMWHPYLRWSVRPSKRRTDTEQI